MWKSYISSVNLCRKCTGHLISYLSGRFTSSVDDGNFMYLTICTVEYKIWMLYAFHWTGNIKFSATCTAVYKMSDLCTFHLIGNLMFPITITAVRLLFTFHYTGNSTCHATILYCRNFVLYFHLFEILCT